LSFGGTIERMLERFAWTMLGVVFLFLFVINILFVPLPHWWETLTGFFQISGLPQPIDWGLLGALAATDCSTAPSARACGPVASVGRDVVPTVSGHVPWGRHASHSPGPRPWRPYSKTTRSSAN